MPQHQQAGVPQHQAVPGGLGAPDRPLHFGIHPRAQPEVRVLDVEFNGHRASFFVEVVGDEVRDVEAAQKAGVDVAAVTWGFQSSEALADLAPTYLIHHPMDLLGLVAHTRS